MKTASFATILIATILSGCTETSSSHAPTQQLAETNQAIQTWQALPLHWHYDPADWRVNTLNGALRRKSSCSDPEPVLMPAALEVTGIPDGASIVAAFVRIDPCDGHAALPDNLPVAALWQVDAHGNIVQAMGGSGQDASPTASAYDVPHDIVARPAPGTSFVLDGSLRTMMLIENEYGADGVGGMQILGVDVAYE